MTANQLKYLELMQTKARDAWNKDVAFGTLAENSRHNVATEGLTRYNNYTNRYNADTNARNANTNEYNALTNRQNADSNRISALANQQNASTNLRNAVTNERNAATNERNAATNERNAATQEYQAQSGRYSALGSYMSGQAALANVENNRMNAQANLQRAATDYQSMLNTKAIQDRQTQIQELTAVYQRQLLGAQAATERANTARVKAQTGLYGDQAANYRSQTNLNTYKVIETSASALEKAARTDQIQYQTQKDFATTALNTVGDAAKRLMLSSLHTGAGGATGTGMSVVPDRYLRKGGY